MSIRAVKDSAPILDANAYFGLCPSAQTQIGMHIRTVSDSAYITCQYIAQMMPISTNPVKSARSRCNKFRSNKIPMRFKIMPISTETDQNVSSRCNEFRSYYMP